MENSKFINLFIEVLSIDKALSKNTLDAYTSDLNHFADFLLRRKPIVYLQNCVKEDVLSYLKYINKQEYAAKSQSRKISALKQFYTFMLNEKYINNNPMVNISNPKVGKSLPKILSANEIETMLNKAKETNLMLYTMLELMYCCGLRVSELVSLKLSSFIEQNRYILVKGKGEKERIIPLGNLAIEALDSWLIERKKKLVTNKIKTVFLFPSKTSKLGYITRERFFQLLKELALSCDLPYTKVSPHVIRHSFATHILHNGGDLSSIQQMLGHTSLTTTEIYTHVLNDKLQDAVFKNHPLAFLSNDKAPKESK